MLERVVLLRNAEGQGILTVESETCPHFIANYFKTMAITGNLCISCERTTKTNTSQHLMDLHNPPM